MKRYNKKWLISTALLLLLFVGIALFRQLAPGAYSQAIQWLSVSQPGLYTVTNVADGDTITVRQGSVSYQVRLIGVDTPETHHPEEPVQCFGREASAFAQSLVEGEEVRLETDRLSDNQDRYDRLLRYVYLADEEDMSVNQQLIEEGYGVSYRSFFHSKLEEFEASEQEAREHDRGLWSSCQPAMNEHGVYTTEPVQ